MNQELKNKILYSNIVTDLILTGKVIGIYLGGSRVLSLESSESDYDIIVITKDYSLQNYHGKRLNIPDYKIHLQISCIKETIQSIKNPKIIYAFNRCKTLQDLLLIKKDYIIYSTKDLDYILNILSKYTEELYILTLENTLNNLTNRLSYPINFYKKVHYHFLTQYFLLKNFLTNKTLGLTSSQINILLVSKISRTIPAVLFEALKNLYPTKYLILRYNYNPIYEEVKQYE